MSEEVVKALTRLETKVEGIETTIAELKSDLRAMPDSVARSAKQPVLPAAGGLVGLAAAVWTGYLQASGRA